MRIGLAQINTGLSWTRQRFKGRQGAAGGAGAPDHWSIFPYSAGLLQAYARAHGTRAYEFLPLLHHRLPAEEAAAALAGADLAGFSAYVWNMELSLAVARRLKQESPRTLVVFGGPQVPDRAEDFLRAHPFVDVACHGEGEAVFLALLEAFPDRGWPGVPGISFLRPDGGFETRPRPARIADLSQVPSPYLSGVFAPLIAAEPDERWLMLWETNRGCPFSCTFCDWGSAVASKVYAFDLPRLEAELEWFAAQRGEFIFCCDANFGILPRDVEIAEMAAGLKARTGYPRTLSVQNTKNATERAYQVQTTLARAGMNAGVTISLQSLDPEALRASRRDNISLRSFQDLQRRYTGEGVETYTDMILALPGETYDSFARGVAGVIAGGQHNRVHFYNCGVLPNAEMADPAYRAAHGIASVPQRIVPMHAAIEDVAAEDVPEYLETVVATAAMPAADWRRGKAFAWLTDLLYYDRLLQLPLALAHRRHGLGFRESLEALAGADPSRFPVLAGVQQFLLEKAADVQQGGPEYCPSPEWLGLYWPADQMALIRLVTGWQIDTLYDEACVLLGDLLRARGEDPSLVEAAVRLNHALLRLPFEIEDLELALEHDVWAASQAALHQEGPPPVPARGRYRVDRTTTRWLALEDWCRHLLFCQNQKRAYLYPVAAAPETHRAVPAAHGQPTAELR